MDSDHVKAENAVHKLLHDSMAVVQLHCRMNSPNCIFTKVDRMALENDSTPANNLANYHDSSKRCSPEWLIHPSGPNPVHCCLCKSSECSSGERVVEDVILCR